ncbi:MAG: DUF4252 domain-containing protein [Bacteroidales bacterium]|nr:DUF4252 domain-containing protein [Bacteroidales bacterium]
MKRNILTTMILFLFLGTLLVNAQNTSALKLYDKYGGKDGYTTVSISKELFGMFATIDSSDPEMQEVKEMMNQLDGIKILMYETKDAMDAELGKFRSEIRKLKTEGYSELMEVKQTSEEVKFLAMKKGDKISELLLVINGEKQAGFITITGLIDMNTIGKLSKAMKFEGMDKLNKLNEK